MKKTKRLTYYLAVYAAEEGGFWTTFGDFESPVADQGETVEEAIFNSEQFLNSVITDMVENNIPLPTPSPVQDLKQKLVSDDGEVLCIVPITVYPPAKTQRINITGKGDTFARIRDYAKSRHLTRSELMIKATLEYIRENQ